jgi:hypothetical protein
MKFSENARTCVPQFLNPIQTPNPELHIKQILPVIKKKKDIINKTTEEENMLGFECRRKEIFTHNKVIIYAMGLMDVVQGA